MENSLNFDSKINSDALFGEYGFCEKYFCSKHSLFHQSSFSGRYSYAEIREILKRLFPNIKLIRGVYGFEQNKDIEDDEDDVFSFLGNRGNSQEYFEDEIQDVLIYLSFTDDLVSTVTVYYLNESVSIEFKKEINKLTPFKPKDSIFLITSKHGSLQLQSFKIRDFENFDLKTHYGERFDKISKLIFERLNEDQSKGIVLLHGAPGTGKTFYIRHLIKSIKDKKLIFIPPYMMNSISSPEFVSFMSGHPNSVLIIEDAEEIVAAREGGSNSGVSNLLNLSDGILNDVLNLSIICTFNAKVEDIDKALLRKGRLIAEYKFGTLSVEDSQNLVNFLGFDHKVTEEMTVSEIYNLEEESFIEEKETMGFG